jgi:hypothetical protein
LLRLSSFAWLKALGSREARLVTTLDEDKRESNNTVKGTDANMHIYDFLTQNSNIHQNFEYLWHLSVPTLA